MGRWNVNVYDSIVVNCVLAIYTCPIVAIWIYSLKESEIFQLQIYLKLNVF